MTTLHFETIPLVPVLLIAFAIAALCAGGSASAQAPAQPQAAAPADDMQDFSGAVVVVPEKASMPEQKAAAMLLDEVEKRSRIRWTLTNAWPADAKAVIAFGDAIGLAACAKPIAAEVSAQLPKAAEGYVVRTVQSGSTPVVLIVGKDPRGVLFGVGRLLREMRMTRDSVRVPAKLAIDTAPKVALRGHQMGFRPKVNTYDGWTLPMWEQYIRDLAIFGTNTIEMIPPRSDDADDSPHFPLPQLEMNAKISQLADDYGMSVWVWYPAMDKDYSDPATVEKALKEWGEYFAKMPRLDAVFVPGGDPGSTQPKYLMALLEKQTEVLHRTHPNAQMWVSPQGFVKEWMDEFMGILQNEQPKWLTGIVFAPQNRISLADQRKATPSQYLIRHYPDITHTYCCQYPVHDWDVAYKIAEDREVINPRPEAQAAIFRWSLPFTCGFISYSEGCHDDVNKMLWSALGWDPDAKVTGILREYARYFIGPQFEEGYAQALLSLERNWQGPLISNASVNTTLQQVRDMEKAASPQVLANWRFQQTLYRANYDALVRRRLIYETELQDRAMDMLRRAPELGSALALDQADAILNRVLLEPVGQELRGRVSDMAEALYQSVRMQVSVPRFKGIGTGRGANFDLIDKPLNDFYWLKARFAEIRALADEPQKLAAIAGIVEWTNPGPGGFYDDLGNPVMQPHLVREPAGEYDPEYRTWPLMGYKGINKEWRLSWLTDAETRYECPLKMHYADLDPTAQYAVRVVYAGDKLEAKMRLVANDSVEVHPLIAKENPLKPVEFTIPKEATAKGDLVLTWTQEAGRGGGGRGCQIAEVWLIRK